MNQPKVDIIIPAYNQGHYLQASVDSALAQTWQNIEVIIIDDGSTDNTAEVGKGFDDERVTYIYQENMGLSAARNTGLRRVTGDYVSFLDSDDLFLPRKIENLVDLLAKNQDAGFATGVAQLIDENGGLMGRTYGKGIPNPAEEWLFGNRIHVGSVLVKAEWLKKVSPFDESLKACEDWDMWLRLAIAGCKMVWFPEPVSQYRVHSQQMTKEALRMKTAMLSVLNKTFDREDLVPKWHQLKSQANAEALVKAAAREFLAGENELAKADLAQAIQTDPSLKENNGDDLLNRLLRWAHAPSSPDPFEYMVRVFDNLPSELGHLPQKRKDELSKVALYLAFKNFSVGDKSRARQYAIKVVQADPRKLVNRHFCSMFLQSLIPG